MDLTVKEMFSLGKEVLKTSGYEVYEADAQTLLGHVLNMDRAKLFLHGDTIVENEQRIRYEENLNRVAAGEPLQYVMGEAYFMGHRFAVDPSVLIPRPETELLCEMAIMAAQVTYEKPDILDLCTGSGALAISIALAVQTANITASDISEAALDTAKTNAKALLTSPDITFFHSDLFENLPDKRYDLIVTNPPYISKEDLNGLPVEVRRYEPQVALDGGDDGLDFYHRIANEAGKFLKPGGMLLAEIGCDQGQQIKAAFEAAGFSEISIFKDLTGRDRIVKAMLF